MNTRRSLTVYSQMKVANSVTLVLPKVTKGICHQQNLFPVCTYSSILRKQYIADFSQAVDDFNARQIPKINQKFLIRHLLS